MCAAMAASATYTAEFRRDLQDSDALHRGEGRVSVGPAGLELVYTPDRSWEMGVGSAYRSYRFRMDDSSAVADGIGEVDFWAPFMRVGWRLGKYYHLDINGGALVGGSITIEDENGNELGQTDYDTAPFIGVTLKGDF